MVNTIRVNLGRLMTEQNMSLTALAGRVGITLANLSILKNNRARAIRFSTLEALCRELGCQPGDLLEYGQPTEPAKEEGHWKRGSAEPETPPAPSHSSNHGLPGDYY
jgi:putative transcriptional regulator